MTDVERATLKLQQRLLQAKRAELVRLERAFLRRLAVYLREEYGDVPKNYHLNKEMN